MAGILATKLNRPFIPPKRVQRPHLTQRLSDGLEAGRQVTLVSAPAGFGKTTCVSEWVSTLDLPVAWLSLDPADDDPGRFFTYLVAALQKVKPNIGREIEPVLRSGQLPPGEIIAVTLINDISQSEERFLLVLDDFQVIQDDFIFQVFEKLIANPPQALHLVLLTREDPSLPLARLRANSRLTEIRAGDLRFSSPEAGRFLTETMGLCLSPADIAALENRTEGWVAGLQLAALAMSAMQTPASGRDPSSDLSSFIANLSGSHRYILSYLTDEVLSRQTDEIQRFLLQTSILDRLSGELCDAVTGRTGSRQLLEQLFTDNLFLVPLDDEQHWYRYHHLFADLLRDLQVTIHKDETAELHRRASRWYAQTGMINDAIQHALAAADYATAVSLIESHAMDMLMQWHVKTVAGWKRAIPDEWCAQSPQANLAFAWMHLIRGNFAQAAPYLERLHALFSAPSVDEEYDPALQSRWLALQSMLLNAQGKPAESLTLGSRAMEIAPEDDINVRSLIYLGLAGAYQQMGDYPRAIAAFESIIQHSRAATNSIAEMLGVSALALLLIQRGQLHLAFEKVYQAVEKMERAGSLPPISTALYGELGSIHYHWFQLEQSDRYFQRAIQVSTLSGYNDAELYYSVILSRLYQMAGDQQAAVVEIRKAADLMRIESPAAVREEVISQMVRISLAQNDLIQAEAALQPHGFGFQGRFSYPNLKPDQMISISSREEFTRPSGLLYLSALRILLHRARTRRETSGLEAGIELANLLIEEMLQRQYIPFVLEALLIRSQMHAAHGNHPAGLADVAHALALAEPEGFISLFVEEGTSIAEALANLHAQELAQNQPSAARSVYIQNILVAFSQSYTSEVASGELTHRHATTESGPAAARRQAALIEPLTDRELDVLRGMAQGLKYEEIAAELFISLNTVRTHVKSVYGKLDVNNRTKAIEKAQRLQIL